MLKILMLKIVRRDVISQVLFPCLFSLVSFFQLPFHPPGQRLECSLTTPCRPSTSAVNFVFSLGCMLVQILHCWSSSELFLQNPSPLDLIENSLWSNRFVQRAWISSRLGLIQEKSNEEPPINLWLEHISKIHFKILWLAFNSTTATYWNQNRLEDSCGQDRQFKCMNDFSRQILFWQTSQPLTHNVRSHRSWDRSLQESCSAEIRWSLKYRFALKPIENHATKQFQQNLWDDFG